MDTNFTPPLEDPNVTGIDRLPPRATFLPFTDLDSAMAAPSAFSSSKWVQPLDGMWKFHLVPRANDGAGFEEVGFDDSNWQNIPVPSNWTLENTGDWPIYTNIQMPFDHSPPNIPQDNPTGLYRTIFELDSGWAERRTVIHFGGVESAFTVYCNGHFVGYSTGSRVPSEFDLTPYSREGANTLAVRVSRWSAGSYVEDQDHWWMAGIFRSVRLLSMNPQAFLSDIFARAILREENCGGRLEIDVLLQASDPGAERLEVTIAVNDPNGQRVRLQEPTKRCSGELRWARHSDSTLLRFTFDLDEVYPWNTEQPDRYTLGVSLATESGRELEHTALFFGFRRFEVRDRQLLINGRPILIRGVNRHDSHSVHGKVVDRQTMIKDIKLLKQLGFNAVRTAHYPNDPEWYDLCDEYGLLIMDEADIECHEFYDALCRDPQWTATFMDRVQRMVHRDKNHPCIFSWSLGNESGYGANHDACAAWARHFDPTRLLHYEGITREDFGQGGVPLRAGRGLIASDLFAPMYRTPEDIRQFVREVDDPRPHISCEYSHAMGNANGNLREYFELFRTEPGVQGGFIWDWVDQGLLLNRERRYRGARWETPEDLDAAHADCLKPGGKWFWGYGGDFAEDVHDNNFCINGLIWPDRTPHPAALEFKKLAQPIEVESEADGTLKLMNRFDFSDLKRVRGVCRLLLDGEVLMEHEQPLPEVPAGENAEMTAAAQKNAGAEGEQVLEFTFHADADIAWCQQGDELACSQISLGGSYHPPTSGSGPKATLKDGVISLQAGGQTLLSRLDLNLWRACTDNDGIRGWDGQKGKSMSHWMDAGFHQLDLTSEEIDGSGSSLSVTRKYMGTAEDAVITVCFEFENQPAGLLLTTHWNFPDSLPNLPRIGWSAELPPGYEWLEWYGRGPHESYSDRKSGTRLGRFASTVSDQYVPYILPQEHGNHTDTRWCTLSNGEASMTMHQIDQPFDFSASHLSAADLFAVRHTCDLKPRAETHLTVDLAQSGLGNNSCGYDTLPVYQLRPGAYELKVLFQVTH